MNSHETVPVKKYEPWFARLIRNPLVASLALATATALAFWPVVKGEFINYDDPDYYTDNPHIRRGLSMEGVQWAFRTFHASNWHPLTWLSHMLDLQLFGKGPTGPHCVNLLLHILNGVLLFGLLKKLTASYWPSLLVAGLFALHPLHVESVAWVAERKDVLSTFFGMLTLLAYVRYVEASRIQNSRANAFYLLSLLAFVLGLMSKPMIVTFPFLMLLLDFWPLRRIDYPSNNLLSLLLWRLVWEKIPFLLLSAASCIVTVHAQRDAMQSMNVLPLEARIMNSLVSYTRYLGKMLWPTDLALPYPHPGRWPDLHVALAAILVVVILICTYRFRSRFPFLVTGWLWYFGTLIPVIGLVQVGSQAMGDRYTYVPLIGAFIVVAWGASELAARSRRAKWAVGLASAGSILGCIGLTHQQASYWQNSEQLFRHAVAVTENNCVALDNVGVALELKGDHTALEWYYRALQVDPNHADTLFNLGNALAGQERAAEAIPVLQKGLRIRPANHRARNNLANALAKNGKREEAVHEYQIALQLEPSDSKIHKNLAVTLVSLGKLDQALEHNRQALQLSPNDSSTLYAAGIILALQGKWDEAIQHYNESLDLSPTNAEVHYNLGYALRIQGRFQEATNHLGEALRLKPQFALAHFNLGSVLMELGLRDQAVFHLKEAIQIDPDYSEAKERLRLITRNE